MISRCIVTSVLPPRQLTVEPAASAVRIVKQNLQFRFSTSLKNDSFLALFPETALPVSTQLEQLEDARLAVIRSGRSRPQAGHSAKYLSILITYSAIWPLPRDRRTQCGRDSLPVVTMRLEIASLRTQLLGSLDEDQTTDRHVGVTGSYEKTRVTYRCWRLYSR